MSVKVFNKCSTIVSVGADIHEGTIVLKICRAEKNYCQSVTFQNGAWQENCKQYLCVSP